MEHPGVVDVEGGAVEGRSMVGLLFGHCHWLVLCASGGEAWFG
jgi:hypothetical protein